MFNVKKVFNGVITSLAVAEDVYSVMDIVQSANKNYKKICYISFSKPYHSFLKYFKMNKINPDKFFFIDCITKSVVKEPKKEKNVVFVSAPNAFGEINDAVRKTLMQRSFDIIIFDSLSSMLVYEKELFVTRFLHGLIPMIKGLDCKTVFIVLKGDVEVDLVRDLGMLIDNTVEIK